MLPQINYDRKFLAKLKSNYFNAKALYETVKENAEEIERKMAVQYIKWRDKVLDLVLRLESDEVESYV